MSVRGAGIPAERLLVRRVSLIRTQVCSGFHRGLESVIRAPNRGAAEARARLSGLRRDSRNALRAQVSERVADRETTANSRRNRRHCARRARLSGAGSRAFGLAAEWCSSHSIGRLERQVCSSLGGRAPAPREHVPVVPLLASDWPRRLAETGTLNRYEQRRGAARPVPPGGGGRRPVEPGDIRLSGPPRSRRAEPKRVLAPALESQRQRRSPSAARAQGVKVSPRPFVRLTPLPQGPSGSRYQRWK